MSEELTTGKKAFCGGTLFCMSRKLYTLSYIRLMLCILQCTFYNYIFVISATIVFTIIINFLLVTDLMTLRRCIMLIVIMIRLPVTEIASTGTAVQQTLLVYLLYATLVTVAVYTYNR